MILVFTNIEVTVFRLVRWQVYRPHRALFVFLPLNPRRFQPEAILFGHMLGHDGCWNHIVLESSSGVGFGYATENPEEVTTEISLCFSSHTACPIARDERLHLNVNELRSGHIAAQDVCVRRVSKGDNGRITPAAEFARYEELTRISPAALFLLGHLVLEGLLFRITLF
jgi:hypothetical protein